MSKYLIISFCFLLLCFSAQAKKLKATLITKDSTEYVGEIKYPLSVGVQEIVINTDKGKKTVALEDLNRLFISNDGENYSLVTIPVYFSTTGDIELMLVQSVIEGDAVNLYSLNIEMQNTGYNTTVYDYYVMRPGDKEATMMARVTTPRFQNLEPKSKFRKRAKEFFADDTELVKAIDDNKYTSADIVELVRQYNMNHEWKDDDNEDDETNKTKVTEKPSKYPTHNNDSDQPKPNTEKSTVPEKKKSKSSAY